MKMKKLLKNAVVYALAASMLVSTPLTASAGLVDAYKVTDGWGNTLSGDEDTGTGTVSSTNTNTTILDDKVEAKIVGITLDKSYVSVALPKDGTALPKDKRPTLTASVIFDSSVELDTYGEPKDPDIKKAKDAIESQITWRVETLDGADSYNDGPLYNTLAVDNDKNGNVKTITLNPKKGTPNGNLKVTASIGGKRYYKDDEKEIDDYFTTQEFTASAEVFIKEYAKDLKFDFASSEEKPENAYLKHTQNLRKHLELGSKSASETITWGTTDSKLATVSVAGVVTFSKSKKGKVAITAINEAGDKSATAWFDVKEGNPVQKIEVDATSVKTKSDTSGIDGSATNKKVTVDLIEDNARTVYMTARITKVKDTLNNDMKDTAGVIKSTDMITWTSKKPNIVDVKESSSDGWEMLSILNNTDNASTVTLIPKAVGSATITAKTTSGKSVNYTVTVKATLKSFEIVDITEVKGKATLEKDIFYTGQTLTLAAKRVPAENTSKITWSTKDKVNGSISAKGVVTFKDTLTGETPVVVSAVAKKAGSGKADVSAKENVSLTVKQSAVSDIKVTDYATGGWESIAVVSGSTKLDKLKSSNNNKKLTFTMPIEKGRVYGVEATLTQPTETENTSGLKGADTLRWTSSKEKVASVVFKNGKPYIQANGTGSATITVRGVYDQLKNGTHKAYKPIQLQFTVKVTQPIKSLTMKDATAAVKQKNGTQNVTSKVTKNPAKATGNIVWTLQKIGSTEVTDLGKGTAVSKAAKIPSTTAGDKYVVTARATETGATATSTITVVTPTSSFTGKVGETENFKSGKTFDGLTKLGDSVKVELKVNNVAPGTGTNAGVTYSVKNSGIISVIDEGSGNYTIRRIGAGSATITFTTADKKSYKVTFKCN